MSQRKKDTKAHRNTVSTPATCFCLERLEPRILLSADSLLDVAIAVSGPLQDYFADNTSQAVQSAELLETTEQVDQGVQLAEPLDGGISEPVFTLPLDAESSIEDPSTRQPDPSDEIAIELRAVSSVYGSDHMSDADYSSYSSIIEVEVGEHYYIEIWLRDIGGITSGISGGSVDVTYTTAYADAIDLSPSCVICPIGEIYDGAGLVDDLGGVAFSPAQGATDWVRHGWITMICTGPGTVMFEVLPGSFEFSQYAAGNVAWTDVYFAAPISVEQTELGEVDVWLVPQLTPSGSDTSVSLPTTDHSDPSFWQMETCDYYVEVWIRSDQIAAAISSGSVDVLFDPQYSQAISVDHGSIFTELPCVTIDNVGA